METLAAAVAGAITTAAVVTDTEGTGMIVVEVAEAVVVVDGTGGGGMMTENSRSVLLPTGGERPPRTMPFPSARGRGSDLAGGTRSLLVSKTSPRFRPNRPVCHSPWTTMPYVVALNPISRARRAGQFPAPGPNRQPIPAMHGNPGFPGAPGFVGGPGFPGAAGPMGGVGNPMRQSKRLYVGNIQLTCNEASLAEFFNSKMREQGFAVEMPGEPVTSVQLNHEKSYAFVEVSPICHSWVIYPCACELTGISIVPNSRGSYRCHGL